METRIHSLSLCLSVCLSVSLSLSLFEAPTPTPSSLWRPRWLADAAAVRSNQPSQQQQQQQAAAAGEGWGGASGLRVFGSSGLLVLAPTNEEDIKRRVMRWRLKSSKCETRLGKTNSLGPKRGNVKLENYCAPLYHILDGTTCNHCAVPLNFLCREA